MAVSQERLRSVLAWVVIALMAGPPGVSVLLGMVYGESPCVLCWAQRTCMMLIGLVGLFVLRYGPRPKYLGLAVLLGTWGVYMALRHSGLHLARDIGQGFAGTYFGIHTYTWSWIIHWMALVAIGVLFFLVREDTLTTWGRELTRTGRLAMGLFAAVVAGNALQAFATTGPPPFMGQADPVRFSFNPRHWVWLLDEWGLDRISLRGAWTVPHPNLAAADPDPASGPLAGLPSLPIVSWTRVGVPMHGAMSALAWDSTRHRFLATTDRYGVYLLDSTLSRVLHHVVLDPGYSIDLTPLAGAAFLGDTAWRELVDRQWDLFVLHHDPVSGLLFVHSSDKSSMHQRIAEAVGAKELLYGDEVFRVLGGINRLLFYQIGVRKPGRRNLRYALYTGADVATALTLSERSGSVKSNLYGGGWENGRPVWIGCSYKGRVWARQQGTVPQFVRWCNAVGRKLVDSSIDTSTIIENVLIPEEVTELPSLDPLGIEWPVELLQQAEERVTFSGPGGAEPLSMVELTLLDIDRERRAVRFRLAGEVTDGGRTTTTARSASRCAMVSSTTFCEMNPCPTSLVCRSTTFSCCSSRLVRRPISAWSARAWIWKSAASISAITSPFATFLPVNPETRVTRPATSAPTVGSITFSIVPTTSSCPAWPTRMTV